MGYGLLALPLAFVALPMYVNLPHFYATQFAVPLTSLGAVLLFSRLIDALADKSYCSGSHFSLSDVAVGCALGYLDFRFPSIQWRNTYPNLDKLHEKLMQRQSFIDSQPK